MKLDPKSASLGGLHVMQSTSTGECCFQDMRSTDAKRFPSSPKRLTRSLRKAIGCTGTRYCVRVDDVQILEQKSASKRSLAAPIRASNQIQDRHV